MDPIPGSNNYDWILKRCDLKDGLIELVTYYLDILLIIIFISRWACCNTISISIHAITIFLHHSHRLQPRPAGVQEQTAHKQALIPMILHQASIFHLLTQQALHIFLINVLLTDTAPKVFDLSI